ncbi:MAG: cache domain-containing protein [Dehalococcoidia bacterium]
MRLKPNQKLYLSSVAFLVLMTLSLSSCGNAGDDALTQEESNSRVAVAAVHVAAAGLGEILEGMDETQQIETIREFIDPIRFFDDASGYFYVYNFDCVNIAHAVDKTLPGQNLSDYQDMRGLYVIRELSTAAQDGSGFVTYYWPHPETQQEQEKVGYVETIPGTGYFIGTGYYPDTE